MSLKPGSVCQRLYYGAIAIAVLLPSLSGQIAAQELLGRVQANNILYVPFEGTPAAGPVFVEINGVRQSEPARVLGSNYVVVVPEDLPGNRHDLRLIAGSALDGEDLGWWFFETDGARQLTFGSILSDAGVRVANGIARGFSEAVVRLEFSRNDGQQSGRLVLSRNAESGDGDEDEISVDDIYLESRFPIFGQIGFARLGNAELGANTLLQDEVSRRGLTFGVVSSQGDRRFTAFVLSPDAELGVDNALGLGDNDNRVAGLSATFAFQRLNWLTLDVAAHRGRSTSLPNDGTGDIEGSAVSAALPIAASRGELSFGLASSKWQTDGAANARSAAAHRVGFVWRLSDQDAYRQSEISFELERVGQDFVSPFNSKLISGEERFSATLDSVSAAWQWALTYETAKTNYKGSSSAATDRLSSLSFSLLHDPIDFTGGGLSGTIFLFSAGVDRQSRLETPAGASAATDNQLTQMSFGVNRVRLRTNWGLRLSFSDLDFDTNDATDERKVFAEGHFNTSIGQHLSTQFFARLGTRETGPAQFKEAEASLTLIQASADGLWQSAFEGSYLVSDDPNVQDGESIILSAARDLNDKTKLVAELAWGNGRYTPADTTDGGVSVGLFLRTDFGFSN